MRTIEDVIMRVRAEYLDMPGLRLTRQQIQRLYSIEHTICQLVLESLVGARFLIVDSDGQYARRPIGSPARHKRTAG